MSHLCPVQGCPHPTTGRGSSQVATAATLSIDVPLRCYHHADEVENHLAGPAGDELRAYLRSVVIDYLATQAVTACAVCGGSGYSRANLADNTYPGCGDCKPCQGKGYLPGGDAPRPGATNPRQIARTALPSGAVVSTIRLPFAQRAFKGKHLVDYEYESAVFDTPDSPKEAIRVRYETLQMAHEGHVALVAEWKTKARGCP